MSERMRRVNASVRQVLADAVPELKDPRIGLITVTGVDKAKPEAARLEALVGGWTYQLGSWKKTSLAPRLSNLAAPSPAKPTASAPAAAKP